MNLSLPKVCSLKSLKKFVSVFVYHGVSAAVPLALTWLEKDPKYLVLIPVVKALWQTVEHELKERALAKANEPRYEAEHSESTTSAFFGKGK